MCHMKALTIVLPDQVNQLVISEAARKHVDAAALCSTIVAEHFLGSRGNSAVGRVREREHSSNRATAPAILDSRKDVKNLFPQYPTLSVELAEKFVAEALKFGNARAFRAFSGRGIGLDPNFVFVEYLQKSHPGGIGVSFYGRPQDHIHPTLLRPGRNPNYSRSIACTQETLKPLIEEIGRSYELKFGRVR